MNSTENSVIVGKRLGKLPPPHDPALLALHRYTILDHLPQAPPAWDETSLVTALGMMLNDTIGCCTCSECGHAIQVLTAIAAGAEVTVPDQSVLVMYSAVSGYVPGNPSTDNGAAISDVLGYMRTVGLDGHKYGAYGSIDVQPLDVETAKQAAYVFGGLDAGWNMPLAAQNMQGTWDIPEGQALTGDWAPGSWGGHSTLLAAYDANGNWRTASWGEWFTVTQRFIDAYLEELWASVSPDWIEKNGTSPDGGFDTAQLDTDVAGINNPGPSPTPTPPNPSPTPTPPNPPTPSIVTEVEHIAKDIEQDVHTIVTDVEHAFSAKEAHAMNQAATGTLTPAEITERERDERGRVVRSPELAAAQKAADDVRAGKITRNQARAILGLPRVDDSDYDLLAGAGAVVKNAESERLTLAVGTEVDEMGRPRHVPWGGNRDGSPLDESVNPLGPDDPRPDPDYHYLDPKLAPRKAPGVVTARPKDAPEPQPTDADGNVIAPPDEYPDDPF